MSTEGACKTEAKAPGKKRRSYNKYSITLGMSSFFSNNMATGIQPNYSNLFRTVILGIPPLYIGIMNSIVGILNIIGIPIGAVMMQKIKLPWGKFRSWLYVAGGLYAFFLAIEFVDFGLPDGIVKYLVAIIPYLMVNFIMTLHVTAVRVSLPLYAPTLADRTASFAASATIGSAGKFIYSAFGLAFITMINKATESESLGYTALAVILSTGFFIATCVYAKRLAPFDPSTKEIKRIEAETGEKIKDEDDVGFWTMLRSIINVPMGMVLCSGIGKSIASQLIGNLVAFYYLYVIGDKSLLAVYLTLAAVLSYVGAQFCNLIAYKWELKFIAAFGLAFYGGCMFLAYAAGANAIAFTVLLALGNIGLQIYTTAETPLYTAVADYSKLKTGKDSSKFIQQFSGLSNKTGTLVSTSVLGFGLMAIGFDANNVTESAIQGLRILVSFGPAVCTAIGFLFVFFVPLTTKHLEALKAQKDSENKAA